MQAVDLLPAPPPLPPTEKGRGLRRLTTALLALQLPLAAVAVVVAGDDAGATDLAAAADRTEELGSLRFEMRMRMSAMGEDVEITMLRGEAAGSRSHMVFDLEDMTEAFGEAPFGDAAFDDGVAMEMFTEGGVLYVRAPLFAAIEHQVVETGGALPPELAALAELGERWGVADLAASGATPDQIAAVTGSGGLGMAQGLEMLRSAAADLDARGSGEVRGVAVTEYEGSITFEDMMAAQGGDLSMFEGMLPTDVEGLRPADLLDAMAAVPLDFEAAIDSDGLVRRVAFGFDESFFEAVFAELGLPGPGAVPDLEMQLAIELFDLDDPGIAIELPVVDDPVDLTPWALQLAQQHGG